MSFKQINTELESFLESTINEEQPIEKLVGHFGDRGGNHKVEMIPTRVNDDGNPAEDNILVDNNLVCTMLYDEGTDSDFASSVDSIEVQNKYLFNYLFATLVMELCQNTEMIKNETVTEKVNETVGDDVESLARNAINNIDEILATLKTYGEGDMDDINTLEDAIEVLRNMVPELQ